jgi:hypothetical protein
MSAADKLETQIPVLMQLDPEVREATKRQITRARDQQRRALDQAMEESLRFVPALLRGQVRKLLMHR